MKSKHPSHLIQDSLDMEIQETEIVADEVQNLRKVDNDAHAAQSVTDRTDCGGGAAAFSLGYASSSVPICFVVWFLLLSSWRQPSASNPHRRSTRDQVSTSLAFDGSSHCSRQ